MKNKSKLFKLLCLMLCFLIIPFSLSACNISNGMQSEEEIKQEEYQDENTVGEEQTGVEQGAEQTGEDNGENGEQTEKEPDGNKQQIEYNMPTLDIIGSLDGISKENEITINTKYKDENQEFEKQATLKWQGSSSLQYPKKNFTIKFESKVKLVDSWGKQKKYCLKANYIDYSQARNVVSAKLYGEIAKTRELEDEFSKLVNGGAIDGYPIVLTLNGEFYGLYTLNIPKDKWLLGMNDETINQAILVGDSWEGAARLTKPIVGEFSEGVEVLNYIELEYNSREEAGEYSWITTSFNAFIAFLNSEEDIKANLPNYTYIERAIDTMLYTQFIYGADNCAKNILWVTYDGIIWTPSIYDLDGTWGGSWDGKEFYDAATYGPNDPTIAQYSNKLWEVLCRYYSEEIQQRYLELRESVLTLENIQNIFEEFESLINPQVREWEKEKWQDVPSQDLSNIEQIIRFAESRLAFFDEEIQNLFRIK